MRFGACDFDENSLRIGKLKKKRSPQRAIDLVWVVWPQLF